ncbi:MAG: ornithine cyclodeaminase family protein [Bdellovibrionota bacterium]
MNNPRWISEAEVCSLLSMEEAIAALEAGLRKKAAGKARNMVKTHVAWGEGHTLHAIGAVFEDEHLVGTKTWAHTEGGATPLFILYDSSTGKLLCVIEAFALGQLRTGGVSGVAAKFLSSPDASEMAMIGTGKQALAQVAAIKAVRKLKRVKVFSPTPENRKKFAEKVKEKLGLEAIACESLEEATKDSPIVTVATRAREPFLSSRHFAKGAHVNAVGAITPERSELSQDVFPRATLLSADSPPQVRKLSREFQDFLGQDETAWNSVRPLSEIVSNGKGRKPSDDLSLFKAMGMGISDLSLAAEIHRRALSKNLGHPFPHPVKAEPRF